MDITTLPEIIVASDTDMRYRDALRWLYAFATYQEKPGDVYAASKLNLDRMRAILARLGNPHEKFQSIHIAGTKGKGSTAALCDSILRAAGIRTGLFTSPHLHTFCERIRVNGEMVARAAVAEGIDRLRAIQPEYPDAVVFEWITALAFDHFARAGVAFAVVETGIGGRLDATNVITPRVSIITSISYDHMAVLGNTLAQIAREKAGIIKPGVPVVSSPQVEEARAVIEEVARARGVEWVAVESAWKSGILDSEFKIRNSKFVIRSVEQNLDFQQLEVKQLLPLSTYRLHLLGAHQATNAATAIAAMKTLGIGDAAIRAGVESARWAGRFEILERDPFIVVDGAHNRDSARQLVATIDALFDGARVQWIFGASNDKDIRGMLAEFVARSPALILTCAHHPRAVPPRELASIAAEFGAAAEIAENSVDALARARNRASEFDLTVVTGSLFVVADARAEILRGQGVAVEEDGVG